MPFTNFLLSYCPRVRKVDDKLVASTAYRDRMFTLGTVFRQVTVDPAKKELVLYRRYFWLFTRTRRISFQDVRAVTYTYQDWNASSLAWAQDSYDLYAVGLRLHNDDEAHLFYFRGAGSFSNEGPLPDWLYWPDFATDWTGNQDTESRAYVEVLQKMLGVSVMPGRS